MDEGLFDNLEGEGKPLDLDDGPLDFGTRLLNKLLKNSGALPEWIQLQKDLEREQEQLAPARARGLRALEYARNDPSRERAAHRLRTDMRDRWRLINDLILKYNMIVPVGAQKAFSPYVLNEELSALEAEIAVFLRASDTTSVSARRR